MKWRMVVLSLGLMLVFVSSALPASAGPSLPVEQPMISEDLSVVPLVPIPPMLEPRLPTTLAGRLRSGVLCQAVVEHLKVPEPPESPPMNDSHSDWPALPENPDVPEFPPEDDSGWEFDGTVWTYDGFAVSYVRGNKMWAYQGMGVDWNYDQGDWSYDGLGVSYTVTEDAFEYDGMGESWTVKPDSWAYDGLGISLDADRTGWTYTGLGEDWRVRGKTAHYSGMGETLDIRSDGAWTFDSMHGLWNVTRTGWKMTDAWSNFFPEKYPKGLNITATFDGTSWAVVTSDGRCPRTDSAGAPGVAVPALLGVGFLGPWIMRRRRA